MRRLGWAISLMAALAAIGLYVTRPMPLDDNALDGLTADRDNGQVVFAAMGCASCHKTENGARDVLVGGKRFVTDFGTFIAPNISPHPDAGIGDWSDISLASAIMTGTSPDGAHYYPSFPYSSYNKAELQDVVDLIAHLRTLPPDPTPSIAHELRFPFNIRASVGGWKFLYLNDNWVMSDSTSPEITRGRYLVEALGHCGECHTPRDALGGPDRTLWLAGAPNPSGDGRIPDIRPQTLDWSAADIVAYLKTGLTPDFDSAGGSMVDVIDNTSQLPDSDLAAIAAYLLALP